MWLPSLILDTTLSRHGAYGSRLKLKMFSKILRQRHSEHMKKTIPKYPQNKGADHYSKQHLFGAKFLHVSRPIFFGSPLCAQGEHACLANAYDWPFLSNSKAVCSTRTASSVYFSSMIQEILISEVLIIIMLMFSLARALNILEATPE